MNRAFVVTPAAMRPASDARRCFYCQKPIGSMHGPDCVLVKQKIKVEVNLTIAIEMELPADWDAAGIDFHLNDSSWCASNAVPEIIEALNGASCLCHDAGFTFIEKVGEPWLDEK